MGLRLDLSDPAIEAAAAVYWTWKERQNALSYDHTDEESDAIYHPMMQAYDALTVNSLNIQDATTSVTLGGAVAATTTIDIDSQGGTIVQNGAITSATNVDLDAGSTIGLNAAISGVSGTLDIDSTGVTTIAAAGNISTGGAVKFGVVKSGTLTTSADIVTTADDITFTLPATSGTRKITLEIVQGGAGAFDIGATAWTVTAGTIDWGTKGEPTFGDAAGESRFIVLHYKGGTVLYAHYDTNVFG